MGCSGSNPSERHRTIVTDPRGRIWIALNRGLSVADPARADGGALPALTHVESLSADGAQVDLRGLRSAFHRAAGESRSGSRV